MDAALARDSARLRPTPHPIEFTRAGFSAAASAAPPSAPREVARACKRSLLRLINVLNCREKAVFWTVCHLLLGLDWLARLVCGEVNTLALSVTPDALGVLHIPEYLGDVQFFDRSLVLQDGGPRRRRNEPHLDCVEFCSEPRWGLNCETPKDDVPSRSESEEASLFSLSARNLGVSSMPSL